MCLEFAFERRENNDVLGQIVPDVGVKVWDIILTIYVHTNNPDVTTEVSAPDLSISDHFKLPECELKTHSYMSFGALKHFNKTTFCSDLHWVPLTQVLNCTDPDKALAVALTPRPPATENSEC